MRVLRINLSSVIDFVRACCCVMCASIVANSQRQQTDKCQHPASVLDLFGKLAHVMNLYLRHDLYLPQADGVIVLL